MNNKKTKYPIEVNNLSFSFNSNLILRNISFYLKRQEFISLIGPNGSGKTTLLRLLWGRLKTKAKAVFIDGVEVAKYRPKEIATKIANVFQEQNKEVDFTVWETVLLSRTPHLKLLTYETESDCKIVEEALKLCGLLPFKNRLITTLSGGELKKVFIAAALAQEAEILLLDEPTTHLDLQNEISILNILKTLKNAKKLSIIAVFHDLNIAASYSDRLILIDKGELVAEGSPVEVINEDILNKVYGTDFLIVKHPLNQKPCVLYNV